MRPPVDLVYTWVDGDDPEWQALKRRYMGPEQMAAGPDNEQWGDEKRYRTMDEIVYAIRSAHRYAPWLRTIFIVITDGQVLPSPVLSDPKVVVVPYSTIMPAEILPSFCSNSIEAYIHKIPGLSEIFLYGNDDYLFLKPVPIEYFVDHDRLRLRGYLQPKPLARLGLLRKGHMKVANRTAMMLYERGFERVYVPEHSYHAMRKSTCEHVWDVHREDLASATTLKFKDDTRAFWWQLLVYAYEDLLRDPIHELTFGNAHLSFHDVERSKLMGAYVLARLLVLSRFPAPTACFNTIPPSWYGLMHRYFAMHLDDGRPPIGDVVQLLRQHGAPDRSQSRVSPG